MSYSMKSIICAACDLFQCNNSHKVDWEELLCSRNIILHFLFGRFLLMCGFFISNSNTIKKSLCKSFRSIHICAYLWHPSHLYSGFGLPGKTQFVGQYSRCDCGPVIASPAHQHHSQPRHTALGADRHLSGAGGHLWRTERGLAGG